MGQKLEQDKLTIQIQMLEDYVKANKIDDFSVLSFLFDLKELNPKLKVPYIYRRLQKEYQNQNDIIKVKVFYSKSLKVFIAARKFIKTGHDETLDNIINIINTTILENYENAYLLFESEFDV